MGKAKKSRLCALALAGLSLFSAPKMEADSFLGIGLSAPCHGLLAARGVYDFNEHFGIQADLGLISGIDLRYKKPAKTPLGTLNGTYLYLGVVGIPPWTYALVQNSNPDGPAFGIDLGAGIETNIDKTGFSFGIEGGLVFPIPPEPDTGAFRVDLNLMYRFPLNKK